MDSLRYSIGLRAHGQRDPLIEYKAEAFKIFEELMVNIKTEICHNIFRSASSLMAFENFLRNVPQQTTHQATSAFGGTTHRHERPPRPGAARRRAATSSAKPPPPWRRPSRSASAPKWAATTLAPAAAGRNTSSAAARIDGVGMKGWKLDAPASKQIKNTDPSRKSVLRFTRATNTPRQELMRLFAVNGDGGFGVEPKDGSGVIVHMRRSW